MKSKIKILLFIIVLSACTFLILNAGASYYLKAKYLSKYAYSINGQTKPDDSPILRLYFEEKQTTTLVLMIISSLSVCTTMIIVALRDRTSASSQ